VPSEWLFVLLLNILHEHWQVATMLFLDNHQKYIEKTIAKAKYMNTGNYALLPVHLHDCFPWFHFSPGLCIVMGDY
jgi:hypothetical protein